MATFRQLLRVPFSRPHFQTYGLRKLALPFVEGQQGISVKFQGAGDMHNIHCSIAGTGAVMLAEALRSGIEPQDWHLPAHQQPYQQCALDAVQCFPCFTGAAFSS